MALATDLVRTAAPNFATTLANSMLISDTSLTLQSATGLSTATAITLVIDATDPVSGAATPTLKEVVTGTLSGTTVSNLLRGLDGTTQQAHASGANVVMWITANLWNDFQTSYLVGHTQLGAHIANLPLTSPKITTGLNDSNNVKVLGITATASAVNQLNLADAATATNPTLSATGTDTDIGITLTPKGAGTLLWNSTNATNFAGKLGYTPITSGFSSASASAVQVTGLTVTVTVPSGGRSIKITAFSGAVANSSANRTTTVSIWDGTVGSGTQLQSGQVSTTNAAANNLCYLTVIVTPAAGSKTYNVSLNTDGAGTAALNASSTAPAYILVEAI